MGRYRDRKFTGCWTCRSRKVKCDEGRPCCFQCKRLGLSCQGYYPKLVWVQDSSSVCRSEGRRDLNCDRTWNGYPTLSAETVDFLIAECEDTVPCDIAVSKHLFQDNCHNPFSVFQIEGTQTHRDTCTALAQSCIIPRLLAETPDLTWAERFLFHHYISHVAHLMMPYEHPRSPWTSLYPAVAMRDTLANEKALLHSLIAHSAFNVARLRNQDQDVITLGAKSYAAAIRYLLPAMNDKTEKFSVTFASIMTLMMAETYLGQTRTWRHHIKGAWNLLQNCGLDECWAGTDFTCVSVQSLKIIKILGETSTRPKESRNLNEAFLGSDRMDQSTSSLVLSTQDFGFTLGASKEILECITSITALETRVRRQEACKYFDVDLQSILSRLHKYRQCESKTDGDEIRPQPGEDQVPDAALDVRNQEMAFVFATYIYLYRTLFDLPPARLRYYVTRTFQHVSAFFQVSERNFSIWPAFIAAVEAYTDEDVGSARIWLEKSTSFGMGNRDALRKVVEEVWRRRTDIAKSLCVELGAVVVDWRDVMQQIQCDVLLI